jgi:hypothetical protein
MTINISNILTQLNTKMTSDSSGNTTELLRRVQAYNSLNNIGVLQYKSYRDLPDVDSSNIGQIVYVSGSEDDSFGTFFFARAIADYYGNITSVDSLNAGWQKIVLNANDSDNFTNVTDRRPQPYTFQGSSFGYITGGSAPTIQNVIQKISFTTDGNSTDVGDLVYAAAVTGSGNTSLTHGYTAGGQTSPVGTIITNIQKFPFASEGNASDVGTLSGASTASRQSGQSSENNGYASAGAPNSNEIEKWPFATDGASADVGDLTVGRGRPAGHSSTTHGYNSGGEPASTVIDKFPFATDANATDVGDVIDGTGSPTGTSSEDNGYRTGHAPLTNAIQKFPFATDANATDIADLTTTRQYAAPSSSTMHGYSAGGGPPNTNVIDKYNFYYNANATDVGDLLAATGEPVGQQQT